MTFYVGEVHLQAIDSYRKRRGLTSPSAAVREVLDVLAEAEGIKDATPIRSS